MAPVTLLADVVDAVDESPPDPIESPLSDDMEQYNHSRYAGDGGGGGVREGPPPADSAAPPFEGGVGIAGWRGSGGTGGAGGMQRGRQPTRDVAPVKKGSASSSSTSFHQHSSNHPNSVLTAYRSRSLSAGRTRPRPSFDIVQDVYDRIGVTRAGGTTGSSSSSFVVAAAAAASAPATIGTTGTTAAASAEAPTAVPPPTTTTNSAAQPDGTKSLNDSNGTSISSSLSRIYRAQGSTVSSPLREKFQKRYFPRTSAAAAKAGGVTAPSLLSSSLSSSPRGREALLETLERRRSRSLSRTITTTSGAIATNATTSNGAKSTTVPSASAFASSLSNGAGAAEALANRGTWPPSASRPTDLMVPPSAVATATDSRNSSPTHSQSVGSLLLKKKQGPFEPASADGSNAAAAFLEPSLSSGDGAPDETSGIMPSVKDRMAIFGGNAKSNASTSKPKGGKERTQTRDYPPKIDIYATQTPPPRRSESLEEMEDEKKDDCFGEYEANTNKTSKRAEGGGTAGVGSSQSSGGAGSRFSRNSTPHNHNLHPQASQYRTAPALATNFTAEPPIHATRNFVATAAPQPRQAAQPQQVRIGIKYTPVIEIPVDETGAVVSGNDNNSFVSSLGADETAIIKQPTASSKKWQLQPSHMSPTAAAIPPLDRFQSRYVAAAAGMSSPMSAPTPCVQTMPSSSSANNKPSTLTTDWMEKMVEERLQAHLAVLEVHMDNQLRHATMQIERQMTTRLTALEDKISALVQAQQQQSSSPLPSQATTGDSNPSRGSYVAGARRGW